MEILSMSLPYDAPAKLQIEGSRDPLSQKWQPLVPRGHIDPSKAGKTVHIQWIRTRHQAFRCQAEEQSAELCPLLASGRILIRLSRDPESLSLGKLNARARVSVIASLHQGLFQKLCWLWKLRLRPQKQRSVLWPSHLVQHQHSM